MEILVGLKVYRLYPVKPVFGEISVISAKKTKPGVEKANQVDALVAGQLFFAGISEKLMKPKRH
jgi:hypothetical protein